MPLLRPRNILLAIFIIEMAATAIGIRQKLGLSAVWLPNSLGFAVAPFQNTIEKVDGVSLTQLGCEDDDQRMNWHNYSGDVTRALGPHYRKLIYYIQFVMQPKWHDPEFGKLVRYALCHQGPVAKAIGCSKNSKEVGIRTISLTGEPLIMRSWPCSP